MRKNGTGGEAIRWEGVIWEGRDDLKLLDLNLDQLLLLEAEHRPYEQGPEVRADMQQPYSSPTQLTNTRTPPSLRHLSCRPLHSLAWLPPGLGLEWRRRDGMDGGDTILSDQGGIIPRIYPSLNVSCERFAS